MKITVHVTKEIYRRAAMCGTPGYAQITENCAIALAVKDIWPHVRVERLWIKWYHNVIYYSMLPIGVSGFISIFDAATPMERLLLPEFSFEVYFPDALVGEIGLQEVKAILEKSETLELAP